VPPERSIRLRAAKKDGRACLFPFDHEEADIAADLAVQILEHPGLEVSSGLAALSQLDEGGMHPGSRPRAGRRSSPKCSPSPH